MHIIIPMEQIVAWNNDPKTNANYEALSILHKLGCPAVDKREGVFYIGGDLEQFTDQHHAVHFVWPEPQALEGHPGGPITAEVANALEKAASMPLNMDKDFVSLGAAQCPECGGPKSMHQPKCEKCRLA
jgi:hypothetical protein